MTVVIDLRAANGNDIPLVRRLLKANNLPFQDISDKIDCIVIARNNGKNVGIGGLEKLGEYGLLRSIVIDEQFQGKGLGGQLCNLLVKQAKVTGVKELYLLTTTAELYFSRLGFRKIQREQAPKAIQSTMEFKELCPASSALMRKTME